jgi:pimeloyl-ACP methyl ester carboxylesterase
LGLRQLRSLPHFAPADSLTVARPLARDFYATHISRGFISMLKILAVTAFVLLACSFNSSKAEELGEEGYANSDGVKIHYVTAGKGPLVVLIHGFPDFWYSWREQIPALAKYFQVVAIDQRGYNLSDKPEGVENYAMPKLVADVDAVVKHFKAEKAIIVGHDWGGMVAWSYAMAHPDKTDKLIILNLPHPKGLTRELANNPKQQKNSSYARDFQKPDAASKVQPAVLTFWVKDPEAKKKYLEALKRSSMEGMLNYYKANYPKEPYEYSEELKFPPVKCSVLMFHGLKDTALLPGALNDTWNWLDQDLTLVTIPEAGHFVQQDAAEKVTKCMVGWLKMQKGIE